MSVSEAIRGERELRAGRFKDRLETIKLILSALEESPNRWTPLVRRMMASSTPWVTQSCLRWLLAEGYVERPSRGLYRLTEKGRQLLAVLL
jgi:DNA-binding HxlR family transcriptional regulator